MVHLEAKTRFDDITKDQPSNTCIFRVNEQLLFSSLSREYVTAEPGTAISVSVRFCRLFDMRLAPHDFLLGLN